jgi:hypothetical protein
MALQRAGTSPAAGAVAAAAGSRAGHSAAPLTSWQHFTRAEVGYPISQQPAGFARGPHLEPVPLATQVRLVDGCMARHGKQPQAGWQVGQRPAVCRRAHSAAHSAGCARPRVPCSCLVQ